MHPRKIANLKRKAKTAAVAAIIFLCYAYVSNSDYETLKLECETGLKVCTVQAK